MTERRDRRRADRRATTVADLAVPKDDRADDPRAAALGLLRAITRASIEAPTPRSAIAVTVRIVCEANSWQAGHAWQVVETRDAALTSTGVWYATEPGILSRLRAASASVRIAPGQGVVGRVFESGQPLQVDAVGPADDWSRGEASRLGVGACMAFPVVVEGDVVAVMEFFHREPIALEPHVMDIMGDAGAQIGQVIRRDRLERLISDQADRERGTFARQLHDNLGQQLAALGMHATRLHRALAKEESELAPTASTLVETVDEAKTQVRGLTKGLLPIAVESGAEIVDALHHLVEATEPSFPDIAIRFEHFGNATVEDGFAASQLYRIAQEGLFNAANHASPSSVVVRLAEVPDEGEVELEIRDDGRGIPDPLPRGAGSGLRIMAHRAGLLGGTLTIESRPGLGTAIRCRAPGRGRSGT